MTVKDIFDFLNTKFPTNTAMEFDNVGILVGNASAEVNKIIIALDCTRETIQIAVENGCNLIITHHPIIFSPLKTVTADSVVYELIKSEISVISMHTNLDVGKNGVNDSLCSAIGLREISPYSASDGYLLKSGVISPTLPKLFAEHIKAKLGGCVKFCDGGKVISKVLVCSGSGGDYISAAISGRFDALVTADIKHHQFLIAKENGISLFDAGHFNTEDIIVEKLADMLKEGFTETEIITFHPENIMFV